MQKTDTGVLASYLRRGLLSGVLLALVLVIIGRLLIPTTSFRSVAAASVILMAYGGLAVFYPIRLHHRHPGILRWATVFGLLAGAVYGSEIILEYILLPSNNSRMGLMEFGIVFALYFLSALATAFRSHCVKDAVLTSVASAIIASLVWVIVVLLVFYVFLGSPRQELVLRAEGDFEDFARSGMKDFKAFVMEDFMGATFFHLLLGPLVAVVLGVMGGLLGKTIASFLAPRH
jgi:hypothetical protein